MMTETGFSHEVLKNQVDQVRGSGKNTTVQDEQQPREHRVRPPAGQGSDTGSPGLAAQESLISLLATGQIPKDMIEEKDFEDDELKSLYTALISGASPASLLDTAPDDDTRSRYTRILMTPVADSTDQMISMAAQCLARIRQAACRKQYDALQEKLRSMDPKDPSIPSLLREAQEIRMKLDKIR